MNCNNNIFQFSPDERIRYWRNFRDHIAKLPDQQALEEVAAYWSNSSVVSYYVDWDAPDTWPTPWEIIHSGELCQSGKAICIYHTLRLAAPRWHERLKLLLIRDTEWGIYLGVMVDDRLLLNYSEGDVVPIDDATTATVLKQYSFVSGEGYLDRI